MKILHLASDEKFIDQAIRVFERAVPGGNTLYVYSGKKLNFVKSPAHSPSKFSVLSGRVSKEFLDFDVVIIHSLIPAWYKAISKIPEGTPIVWLGWGFDYYDYVFSSKEEALLPRTRGAQIVCGEKKISINKVRYLLAGLLKYWLPKKEEIIDKIDIFCPVLPCEYSMVRKRFSGRRFPEYARWNYGCLEDDLIKGFESARVTGDSILVGNSASFTNNHLDVFDLFLRIGVENREIVTPLSYGNAQYRDFILKRGRDLFADSFDPMVKFLPLNEYVKKIQSCGFVVMNHVRQQAVGNILIMLYLGAKVFLRMECSTYAFFREQGVILFSIQELEETPDLLNDMLDDNSVTMNR